MVLRKDFSYYFIKLHLLQAELQRRKADGGYDPKTLPLYLKKMMDGHLFAKMTPEERATIKALKEDVQKNFGK